MQSLTKGDPGMKRNDYKQDKKRKRRKKVALWIGVPILAVIVGSVTYGAYLYNEAKEIAQASFQEVPSRSSNSEEDKPKREDPENTSVLFIGVDDSESRDRQGNALSDALMLATFNQEEKSVKLVSIPRDSYVNLPGEGFSTKITEAHAYGGTDLTIQTVEELLDIPIDYYVKMNFEAFMDTVDAFDGVEVNVPYEMYEQDSNDTANAIHLLPGEQLLNGEEALAYVRTRKMDNDIERGKRQQEVLTALLDRATSFSSLTKYRDAMQAVGDNMTTNMRWDDMTSYFSYAMEGANLDIERTTLEGSDWWMDFASGGRAYYWKLDEVALEEVQNQLQTHLGLTAQNDSGQYASPRTDDQSEDSRG